MSSAKHLTMISHFNGIALLPYAAAQAGIVTVATTEIDPFCNAISKQWFPHATQYTDIRAAKIRESADIICGGDPCQPHSSNGKRRGREDARYLWPPMLASINEKRPTWVVNENVIGSVTNGVLDGKAADLEAIGYQCQAYDFPAGAYGAPHLRRRVILVAHTASGRRGQYENLCQPHPTNPLPLYTRLDSTAWPADGRLTVAELLRMADGSAEGLDPATRAPRLKALGNAVVPQVFVPIFQAIAHLA